MARPTKLNDDTHKAIVDAIKIGATYKDAAGAAGVDYTTFLNWMARGGKAKSGKFFEFFNAVGRAKSQAILNYTTTIATAAAKGEWRAALEYLKRRDPDNWGDRSKTDITSGGEKIIVRVFEDDAS